MVYQNRAPVHAHPIEQDETLIGRYDPTSDAYPDLDLTPYDPDRVISRKHCYVYRQGGHHQVYAISNAGTQVNNELVSIGRRLDFGLGDVLILGGGVAIKFEQP